MIRRLSRPYAEALLGAARDLDEAGRVRDQLEEFASALHQVPELAKMALNPVVPLEVKERVLRRLADEMGLETITRRFLQALLVRYRLPQLGEIVAGVTELLNARRGVAVARVATAAELPDDRRDRLRAVLEEKLGQRVQFELEVDPDLIAGFVARVGSTLYDASLKGQLRRLTADLARA